MSAGYPMRRDSGVRRLNADRLPEPYRSIIARRVRDDAAVFAERPDLAHFDRPSVAGEFYPVLDPPAGSTVRVVNLGGGRHARMLHGADDGGTAPASGKGAS